MRRRHMQWREDPWRKASQRGAVVFHSEISPSLESTGSSITFGSAMRRFLAMPGADPVRQSNAHYRPGMIKERWGSGGRNVFARDVLIAQRSGARPAACCQRS